MSFIISCKLKSPVFVIKILQTEQNKTKVKQTTYQGQLYNGNDKFAPPVMWSFIGGIFKEHERGTHTLVFCKIPSCINNSTMYEEQVHYLFCLLYFFYKIKRNKCHAKVKLVFT